MWRLCLVIWGQVLGVRGFLGGCGIGALWSQGIGAASRAPGGPVLAARAFSLEGLCRCIQSCHPVRGLFGHCQLPNLPVGWGRWHGDLPLECGEINLLPPQSDQVGFGIQERVPITSFEDWIHGPEVTHNLQWARLPCGRINQ